MQNLNKKKIQVQGTIGIIGGGQLGQMLAQSARILGMQVIILDPNKECPAAYFADDQIVAAYSDFNAIDQLATQADVLTYEFENVDVDALKQVANKVEIPQGTDLLEITRDRIKEKTFLNQNGFLTTAFRIINSEEDLKKAIKEIGMPCFLKTCKGGYDGKGQTQIKSEQDFKTGTQILKHKPCILEKKIDFKLECSVMVGRSLTGDVSVFPVSENIHQNQILHESIVPARIEPKIQKKIQTIAVDVANKINLYGILGIEMFVGIDDQIYINELAPRPHNSGHYSIEACNFSQFDIHNKAICGWKMPQIDLLSKVIMINVLGQHLNKVRQVLPEHSNWHFHDYRKDEIRKNRKMGHITILTDNIEEELVQLEQTNIWNED